MGTIILMLHTSTQRRLWPLPGHKLLPSAGYSHFIHFWLLLSGMILFTLYHCFNMTKQMPKKAIIDNSRKAEPPVPYSPSLGPATATAATPLHSSAGG